MTGIVDVDKERFLADIESDIIDDGKTTLHEKPLWKHASGIAEQYTQCKAYDFYMEALGIVKENGGITEEDKNLLKDYRKHLKIEEDQRGY